MGGLFMKGLILIAAMATTSLGPRTFGGYDCNNDCAQLATGYAWAADNEITLIQSCLSGSEDFQRGCWSYLANPLRGYTQDDQGGDIDQ